MEKIGQRSVADTLGAVRSVEFQVPGFGKFLYRYKTAENFHSVIGNNLEIVVPVVTSLVNEMWQSAAIRSGITATVNGENWAAKRPRYGVLPIHRMVYITSPEHIWHLKSDGIFRTSLIRDRSRVGFFRFGRIYFDKESATIHDLASLFVSYAHDLHCLVGGPLSRLAAIEGFTPH